MGNIERAVRRDNSIFPVSQENCWLITKFETCILYPCNKSFIKSLRGEAPSFEGRRIVLLKKCETKGRCAYPLQKMRNYSWLSQLIACDSAGPFRQCC